MKRKLTYRLSFRRIAGVCLLFLLINTLAAKDLFYFADSLKSAGQFEYAAVEYERVYFYSDDNNLRTLALIQKAECLKFLQNFELAEKCLKRINYSGLNDTLAFQARYQTALAAYLAGNNTNAESFLLQLNHFTKDSTLKNQSLLLYALVLNELKKWDEANDKLQQWVNFHFKDSLLKTHYNELTSQFYHPEKQPLLKKGTTAKILSLIVPGSGQIYAGYFWEGVSNALIQGTALFLSAYGIYSGFYITSGVIWLGIFQRFYMGALQRIDYLVEKKNFELVKNYNKLLKEHILMLKDKQPASF